MKKILLFVLLCILATISCEQDRTIIPNMHVTRLSTGFSDTLTAITFVGNKGYIVGENGTVLRSEGGDEWTKVQINAAGTDLNYVFFPSVDVGYISGPGKLYRTTDGGNTWNLINSSYNFTDVTFPSENTGYMMHNDSVYKTTDGGQNWFYASFTATYAKIGASDSSNVFVYSASGGKIHRTTNGGTSWSTLLYQYKKITYFYFRNNLSGMGITNNNFYITSNGGSTWKEVGDYNSKTIRRVYMPTASMAYAVGGQYIFVSKNGGSDWESYFTQDGSSITENLMDVYFINSTTGYAISREGGIFKLVNEK